MSDFSFSWLNKSNLKDLVDASHVNYLGIGIRNLYNWVVEQLTSKVSKSGNESVSGIKTHSEFPVLPTSNPTTNYQAAHKKYVDDTVSTIVVSGSGIQYAIDSGTANNYIVSPIPAISSYTNGYRIGIMIANTNTSQICTLTINSLSSCPIYLTSDGSYLPEIGELLANNIYDFIYNNGAFILV